MNHLYNTSYHHLSLSLWRAFISFAHAIFYVIITCHWLLLSFISSVLFNRCRVCFEGGTVRCTVLRSLLFFFSSTYVEEVKIWDKKQCNMTGPVSKIQKSIYYDHMIIIKRHFILRRHFFCKEKVIHISRVKHIVISSSPTLPSKKTI